MSYINSETQLLQTLIHSVGSSVDPFPNNFRCNIKLFLAEIADLSVIMSFCLFVDMSQTSFMRNILLFFFCLYNVQVVMQFSGVDASVGCLCNIVSLQRTGVYGIFRCCCNVQVFIQCLGIDVSFGC